MSLRAVTFGVLCFAVGYLGWKSSGTTLPGQLDPVARLDILDGQEIDPLAVGDVFGARNVLEPLIAEGQDCWEAYVVDPLCSACQALAETVGGGSGRFWISAGAPEQNEEFVRANGIAEAEFSALNPGRDGTWQKLMQSGIWVVPVALTVRDGKVAHLSTVKDPTNPPSSRCVG